MYIVWVHMDERNFILFFHFYFGLKCAINETNAVEIHGTKGISNGNVKHLQTTYNPPHKLKKTNQLKNPVPISRR